MKALTTLLVIWSAIPGVMIVSATDNDIAVVKELMGIHKVKLSQSHEDRVYFKENSI